MNGRPRINRPLTVPVVSPPSMRVCVSVGFVLVCSLMVWGCSMGPEFVAKNEPWREDEERACLTSGYVRATPFVQARAGLGGPSACGALQPFTMSAADNGGVPLQPAALLRCPMIPVVQRWVEQGVEPAARAHLRRPLAEGHVAASSPCRPLHG